MTAPENTKSARNKTLTLSLEEHTLYKERLLQISGAITLDAILNKTVHQDSFEIMDWLPPCCVDLLFLDPPYNLTKAFNTDIFRERSLREYILWFESWFSKVLRLLKPTASVYICGDWRSSAAIHLIAEKHLRIHNRITWEREKGRGAKTNWKNCSEDIWFCTMSDDYTFNVEAVKLKRKVIAPYTDLNGDPKDWEQTEQGGYRLTHPSNIWTDLTVPFWSMPENTEHPTQKPEKLLAKIILASSHPGDLIFDPFLGSGTTSVVARKLDRCYLGVEKDETYCCLAEKRLALAEHVKTIQGYHAGVFWERNSQDQPIVSKGKNAEDLLTLFDTVLET
jgi:site-specific DNA-methyltransferase (adenine-specific)